MPIEAVIGIVFGLVMAAVGCVFTYWFYKKTIYPEQMAEAALGRQSAAYGCLLQMSDRQTADGRPNNWEGLEDKTSTQEEDPFAQGVPEEIVLMVRLLEHSHTKRARRLYL